MARPDRLNVWLEAFDKPIGRLARNAGGALSFTYAEDYLNAPAAMTLSLSMPLTDEPYDDVAARAFFDNLLQENDSLRAVMARESLARDDLVGVLSVLGADCPGAISCLAEDSPPVKRPGDLKADYDVLVTEDLRRHLIALAETGAPAAVNRDPSPLAGVQPKFAVALLPDGRFALPKKRTHVPTTHIIKAPRRRDATDAKIEYACTSLAWRAGVSAISLDAFDRFGVQGLLIQRFDRVMEGQYVYRLHQEDFAQALGLPAAMKYERNGREHRRFDASAISSILDRCARPAEAREQFIDLTLFNLLIGNVDNHAKNHALLYRGAGSPSLAPAYDLLATRLNASLTDEFAFRLGTAARLDALAAADLGAFMAALGLRGRGAARFLEKKARALLAAIASRATLDELTLLGQKRLADHIAHAARHIGDALNFDDLAIPERDAFILSGGGWAIS